MTWMFILRTDISRCKTKHVLLLRLSDFEEEKHFEMMGVFMSAQAGVCAWFENSI